MKVDIDSIVTFQREIGKKPITEIDNTITMDFKNVIKESDIEHIAELIKSKTIHILKDKYKSDSGYAFSHKYYRTDSMLEWCAELHDLKITIEFKERSY